MVTTGTEREKRRWRIQPTLTCLWSWGRRLLARPSDRLGTAWAPPAWLCCSARNLCPGPCLSNTPEPHPQAGRSPPGPAARLKGLQDSSPAYGSSSVSRGFPVHSCSVCHEDISRFSPFLGPRWVGAAGVGAA